jgi:hypothetical protein
MRKQVVKPTPPPPPLAAPMTWMDMREYMAHLGKSRGFIYKLIQMGMPHMKTGDGRTASLMFPVERADAWFLQRFETKRSGVWRPPQKPKAKEAA